MGIADFAREKAQTELEKAQADIATRSEAVAVAQQRVDAAKKALADRVKAEESATDAKVADLNMQLNSAEADLAAAKAASDLTDAATKPGFIHDVTESVRQGADVQESKDQAKVDALKAEISDAEAQTVNTDSSPELSEAEAELAEAQGRLTAAKTRAQLAQKALDALG